jgi:protein-disulfide isomerase
MMRPLLLFIPWLALLAPVPMLAASVSGASSQTTFKETGSPGAPLTLELYMDYQSPQCRRVYLYDLPSITSEYVATGKVRLIRRDFPIPQYAYSSLATRYANAAGQLGRYDVVSAQIFKTQMVWDQDGNIDAEVAKVVSPSELQKIRELVKNDSHLDDTVTADQKQGNHDHLREVPTYVFVSHGKRDVIDGAVPFATLKQYLDQQIAQR